MSLTEFAERELREAGLFDNDSDYGGMIGPCVLDMVKRFAEEEHSGYSAHMTVDLFRKLALYQPINPLKNPMESGEYIDHTSISAGNPTYQSTRKSSVFSEDGGKTWYDIDKRIPRWKRWLGARRAYITFPY